MYSASHLGIHDVFPHDIPDPVDVNYTYLLPTIEAISLRRDIYIVTPAFDENEALSYTDPAFPISPSVPTIVTVS